MVASLLRRREANVARNNKKLAALGLPPSTHAVKQRRATARQPAKRIRRKLAKAKQPTPGVRSSRRLKQQQQQQGKGAETHVGGHDQHVALKGLQDNSPQKLSPAELAEVLRGAPAGKLSERASAARAGVSSKLLDADLKSMQPDGPHLGKHILPPDGQIKGAVMTTLNFGRTPRFSRMSGIQEWNNAVCLFVNVGGDDYNNMFLGGGKFVTWYAQRRQHEATPVIARMLLAAARDSKIRSGDIDEKQRETMQFNCPVMLFCRLPKQPYVYMGRLRYKEHDGGVRPMRFVWELCDHDKLQRSKIFREVVQCP